MVLFKTTFTISEKIPVLRQDRTLGIFNREHGTVNLHVTKKSQVTKKLQVTQKLQVTKKLQVTFQPGYFGSGKVKEGGCIEIADCSSDPCHNGQCVDLEVG